MPVPFDPDPTELHDLGRAALDLVVDFVGRRPSAPAVENIGGTEGGRKPIMTVEQKGAFIRVAVSR